MQFSQYSPVPATIMEAVMARRGGTGSSSTSKKKEVI
jgi:hypothetical protein